MFEGFARAACRAAGACAWGAVALLGISQTLAQPTTAPAADFARRPAIEDVIVSPSGKRLAVLVFGPTGMRQVGVMDLDPMGKPRVVGSFEDADVESVQWVNDDRLLFGAYARGVIQREGQGGTFAVNHDGSEMRQLISWSFSSPTIGGTIASRVLPFGWHVHSMAHDGGDEILVYQRVVDGGNDFKKIQLARLNTRNGILRNLSYNFPDRTHSVWLDAAREPRVLQTWQSGSEKTWWREPGGEAWTQVFEVRRLDQDFEPWYLEKDGKMIVRTRLNDAQVLQRFDLRTRTLEPEPLVQVKGFDVDGGAEYDGRTHRLMGVHLVADRQLTYWFDDTLAQVQEGIDAALPKGRSNRLYCGECETSRFIGVRSQSDRQPGEYYLFDRKSGSLKSIGTSRPWVREASQGARTFHRYEARDGLRIPVVVTHPPGTAPDKPLPTVVLVHGGPFVRGGDLAWDADAQFLASRGYRVLAPEFRGSRGFGYRHFTAGWKQWGTGMQDDIADAVAWGAKQGLVDAGRVCVMGASFGGYSALMSPIRHPKTYRCAVSLAGVTDPMIMYSVGWSDLSQSARDYGMPATLGDPEKDAALLADASPLLRVAELKVPVLLAYGGLDRRVPSVHAEKFASAAEKAGVKLEKVQYPDEFHGFRNPANLANFYERVERFLEANLK